MTTTELPFPGLSGVPTTESTYSRSGYFARTALISFSIRGPEISVPAA